MSRRLEMLIKVKRAALHQAEQRVRHATTIMVREQALATRIVSASRTFDPAAGIHGAQAFGASMELAGRVRTAAASAADRSVQSRLTAQMAQTEHAAARRRLEAVVDKLAEARRADERLRERRASTTKGTQ